MPDATYDKALCRATCPAGVDVPRYIRHLKQGDFAAALAVIRESIPWPAVCGYACAHPCEARCARGPYDAPVAIRLLKRAAATYGQDGLAPPPALPASGKKVAVIGAGPCGLTAAYYLAGLGHAVTVFEAQAEPGGLLRYGIPAYRLPREVLAREIGAILDRGVNLVTRTRISEPKALLDEGFAAVLVAVGAWRGRKLILEGSAEGRVRDGLSFLKEVNAGARPELGPKVVVVGGGNTALDAARTALRLGAAVTLVYRRTRLLMPADQEEVEAALEEGVRFLFLAAPVNLAPGRLICRKMTLGAADESGRRRPVPLAGSEFEIACDTLIAATGQAADAAALNLPAAADGTIRVDPLTFATAHPGIFAAGDAVSGPSSIIEAIAQGKQAALAVDRYLGGAGRPEAASPEPPSGRVEEAAPWGTGRVPPGRLAPEERRRSFAPVEPGYDPETAVAEARRCLACDLRQYKVEVSAAVCKGCGYCREVCALEVFGLADTFNAQGYRPAVVKEADRCMGCLRCLYVCPDFAISVEDPLSKRA